MMVVAPICVGCDFSPAELEPGSPDVRVESWGVESLGTAAQGRGGGRGTELGGDDLGTGVGGLGAGEP